MGKMVVVRIFFQKKYFLAKGPQIGRESANFTKINGHFEWKKCSFL